MARNRQNASKLIAKSELLTQREFVASPYGGLRNVPRSKASRISQRDGIRKETKVDRADKCVMVTFTLEQAMKSQRGSTVLFL
jgi:hypothetical protein